MRALYFFGLVPLALGLLPFADPVVDKHSSALQKAQSVVLKITATPVGGAPEEQTLTLSKPNLYRWESSSKLAVCDGATVWTYDKAKKQFTKTAASNESVLKGLAANDVAWIWSAFFNPAFGDQITATKKGSGRKMRNFPVTDLMITRKDTRTYTLFIDDVTGVARGAQYTTEEGGTKQDVIVFAKELTLSEKPVEVSAFAFVPPADATDAAAAPAINPKGLHFADIKTILDTNCTTCHSGPMPKGRVTLTSYAGALKQVKPGDPDGSKIIKVIRSGKMPPTGSVPDDQVDKLAQWIKDGAQE